jgi:hypothetical protein
LPLLGDDRKGDLEVFYHGSRPQSGFTGLSDLIALLNKDIDYFVERNRWNLSLEGEPELC